MKKDIAIDITKSIEKTLTKKWTKFQVLFKGVTPRLTKVEKTVATTAKVVKSLKDDVAENQVELAEINKVLADDKEGKELGLFSRSKTSKRIIRSRKRD